MKHLAWMVLGSIVLFSAPAFAAPSWTLLAPDLAGPTHGEDTVCEFDTVDGVLLAFGGKDGSSPIGKVANETWLFDGRTKAWREVRTTGSLPPGRQDSAGVYDPAHHRFVIFAGAGDTASPTIVYDDLWLLDLSSGRWTEITPSSGQYWPPAMRDHRACYDSLRHRRVDFHGGIYALDLDTNTWSRIDPTNSVRPGFADLCACVYDSSGDRMIVYRDSGIFAFEFGTAAWRNLYTSGSKPPSLTSTTGVYDPTRGIFKTFGGQPRTNQTWLFDLVKNTWQQINPSNPPTARFDHRMVFDPVDGQALNFGGDDGIQAATNGIIRTDVNMLVLDPGTAPPPPPPPPPDTTTPHVVERVPAPGATDVPATAAIVATVRDEESGVDVSSVRLFVNGGPGAPLAGGPPGRGELLSARRLHGRRDGDRARGGKRPRLAAERHGARPVEFHGREREPDARRARLRRQLRALRGRCSRRLRRRHGRHVHFGARLRLGQDGQERGDDRGRRRDPQHLAWVWNNNAPVAWHATLPDGDYDVSIVCGDPVWSGIHRVVVEGTAALNDVPTANGQFASATVRVHVSGGTLDVTIGGVASGQKKTKICNLKATPVP